MPRVNNSADIVLLEVWHQIGNQQAGRLLWVLSILTTLHPHTSRLPKKRLSSSECPVLQSIELHDFEYIFSDEPWRTRDPARNARRGPKTDPVNVGV